MTKTFLQSKTNDKFVGIFPLEFADGGTKAKDDGAIPSVIHLVPIGQWEHDLYGPIMITSSDIKEFITNFNAGVRKGVFITCGHEGYQELPAAGWVTSLEERFDGLWGIIEWNELGKKALKEKEYKFFSPEMCRDYEDPQTHQFYRNVLTGGALTKSPYFKELQAIVFSDKVLQSKFNEQAMPKTLEEILALELDALTDEDKAVLKEKAGELSDEQKAKYASVLEEPKAEDTTPSGDEAPKDGEVEEPKGDEPAGDDTTTPSDDDKGQNLSEKKLVTIEASELAILRNKADKGEQAFKELEQAEIKGSMEKMTFSASNKAGKFLPKSEASLKKFMESLNKAQRTAFSNLVAEIPATEMFGEKGNDNALIDGTSMAEVESKVQAKMKANDKLSYSEALKQVMSENKGLEERYDSELPSARKGA